MLFCEFDLSVHKLFDLRISPEIPFDILFRVGNPDRQVLREPEVAYSVNYSEVDRFCIAAHFVRYVGNIDAINLRSGRGVNIAAFVVRPYEVFVAAHVRHKTKFDLRIVGGNQHFALFRDERTADFLALDSASRDILKVRLGRRQPARVRKCLLVFGMHAPVGRHRLFKPQHVRR